MACSLFSEIAKVNETMIEAVDSPICDGMSEVSVLNGQQKRCRDFSPKGTFYVFVFI